MEKAYVINYIFVINELRQYVLRTGSSGLNELSELEVFTKLEIVIVWFNGKNVHNNLLF